MMRLAAILLLFLAGCAKRPAEPSRESRNPPPSSSYPMAQVDHDAAEWVARDPAWRHKLPVAGTGSMLPMFGKNSVLLLERTDGDVTEGDVALYEKTDNSGTIVHRAVAIGDTAVIFSGDNNHGSDGWISKTRIRWRVAGILYSQRS